MDSKKNLNEMVSLNAEFSEFKLQELEERLETDPLAVGGLLDVLSVANPTSSLEVYGHCTEISCNYFDF